MKNRSWRDAPGRLQHINGRVAWAEGYGQALEELMNERTIVDLLREKVAALRSESVQRGVENPRVAAYLLAQADVFSEIAYTLNARLEATGAAHGYQY
jgi:hypothetical protein